MAIKINANWIDAGMFVDYYAAARQFAAGEKGFNGFQGCQESHGLRQCGDQCVNIQVDKDNCGDCGSFVLSGGLSERKVYGSPCRKNCSDNNPCTNDYCEKGKCINEPIVCEQDGDLCTLEQMRRRKLCI